jgi:glycosyltransferase involved in cell wall biosynthesis
VLAVDESLRERLRELAGYDGANIEVVPTGYDAGFWTPGAQRQPSVLTVAAGCDRTRFLAKGVDRFIECAAQMPDVPFRLVGMGDEITRWTDRSTPANLQLVHYLEREALRETYRSSSVYLQASRTEGLPNSLCEAMLCGCVPVGTKAGGIPTAIGDAGILVEPDDARSLPEAVRAALNAPESLREAARTRIAELFPLRRREQTLNEIIAGARS